MVTKRNFSVQEQKLILREYGKGTNPTEIGLLLGCSSTPVKRFLKDRKIYRNISEAQRLVANRNRKAMSERAKLGHIKFRERDPERYKQRQVKAVRTHLVKNPEKVILGGKRGGRKRAQWAKKNPEEAREIAKKGGKTTQKRYPYLFRKLIDNWKEENPDAFIKLQKAAFKNLLKKYPNHQKKAGKIGGKVRGKQLKLLRPDQHPQWKGGITDKLYSIVRKHTSLTEWSKKVKKRDDSTCQYCEKRGGGSLHSHHIVPLHELIRIIIKENPNTNWKKDRKAAYELARKISEDKRVTDIDNGITLCNKCHYKTY